MYTALSTFVISLHKHLNIQVEFYNLYDSRIANMSKTCKLIDVFSLSTVVTLKIKQLSTSTIRVKTVSLF